MIEIKINMWKILKIQLNCVFECNSEINIFEIEYFLNASFRGKIINLTELAPKGLELFS